MPHVGPPGSTLAYVPGTTELMDSQGAEACFSMTDAALGKQAGIFDDFEGPGLLAPWEGRY